MMFLRLKNVLAIFGLAFLLACSNNDGIRVVEENFPNGKEKIVRYYKDSKNEKILLSEEQYYDNGQIKSKGDFKNNQRHGLWTYWYENGNVWSEGKFKNGLSHGFRKVYHLNGEIYYEGKYKNDKPIGTWTFWDEEGRFIKEHKY